MRFTVANDYTFQIRKGYADVVDKAMRATVLNIVADAQLNITAQDSIDTGAAKASIYASTPSRSGYADAEADARESAARPGRHSGRPNKEFQMLPERVVGPMEAVAAVGAEYATYIEFGTVFTPPAPFFGPAEEKHVAAFEEVCVNMINREVK